MFFEGSEKKIEVIVKSKTPSLRSLGKPFWEKMVSAANAEILSQLSSDSCDAYLLSESSLFVWDDRFLMLTCGTTTLVESVILFIQTVDTEKIDFLIYQRKNEYRSQLQKSSVDDDLQRLRTFLPIKAYQLGDLDSHHHYFLHTEKPYQPANDDTTSELLMYHIQGEIADYLRSENQDAQTIRDKLGLDIVLPDFVLDDFVFTPFGYSLNALRGSDYATIHITPEQNSSYVSFETNLDLGGEFAFVMDHFLARLNPRSWDTVGFNCHPSPLQTKLHGYKEKCQLPLSGYQVYFSHHKNNPDAELPVLSL